MENHIMYAELAKGITTDMLNDPKVRIISDTGLFLVTRQSNTSTYPALEFKPIQPEALEVYDIKL